jgi:hypothetical protein
LLLLLLLLLLLPPLPLPLPPPPLLLLSVLLSSLSDSKNQPTRLFSVPAMTVAAPAARIKRTMSSCAACSVAASARVSE